MYSRFVMKNILLSMLLSSVAMESHSTDVERMNANELVGRVVGDRHLRLGDHEAAMDWQLNAQILNCFTVIYNRLPTVTDNQVNNAFNEVISFINSPLNRRMQRPKPVRLVLNVSQNRYVVAEELPLRADPLMHKNALRTMMGSNEDTFHGIDANYLYASCITVLGSVEVRVKELLARVWNLINAHSDQREKQMMKESLFANLNYCIEDDGHLTCGAGITKRLIMSIEGYIEGVNLTLALPEPSEFCSNYLTELFENLNNRYPDDPLNFVSSLDVPESFSLQDLENRIALERGIVHLRINGVYGAGSQKARSAIAIMEEKFEQWRTIYNDNLPAIGARPIERPEPVSEIRRPAPSATPTIILPQTHDPIHNDRIMYLLRLMEILDDRFFQMPYAAELERLMAPPVVAASQRPVEASQQPISILRHPIALQQPAVSILQQPVPPRWAPITPFPQQPVVPSFTLFPQQPVVAPQQPVVSPFILFPQQPVIVPQRPMLSPKAAARAHKAQQKAAAGARKAAAKAQKTLRKAAARAHKAAQKSAARIQKAAQKAQKASQKIAARNRKAAQKAAARGLRGPQRNVVR